jgi:hypothetical protein
VENKNIFIVNYGQKQSEKIAMVDAEPYSVSNLRLISLASVLTVQQLP